MAKRCRLDSQFVNKQIITGVVNVIMDIAGSWQKQLRVEMRSVGFQL